MQMRVIRRLIAFLLFAVFFAPPAHADVDNEFTSNDDPLVVARVIRAIERLAKEFPELDNVTVKSGHLDLDTYATAGGSTIMFNSAYTYSARIIDRMIITDVAAGYHPDLGYCMPEQLIAYHEAAHIIDAKKNRRPSDAVAKRYGTATGLQLSGYSYSGGALNPVEALAEAVASTLCNGGSPLEQEMFKLLEGN
jgi:hypothetical protein